MQIVPQNFLKAARVLLNLNQEQLAEAANIAKGTVARFEAGAGIRDENMNRIIAALRRRGVGFTFTNGVATGLYLIQEGQ